MLLRVSLGHPLVGIDTLHRTALTFAGATAACQRGATLPLLTAIACQNPGTRGKEALITISPLGVQAATTLAQLESHGGTLLVLLSDLTPVSVSITHPNCLHIVRASVAD